MNPKNIKSKYLCGGNNVLRVTEKIIVLINIH